MTRLSLTGNTYGIRETLKSLGFRWDPNKKAWVGTFETEEANELAHRWHSEGVYAETCEVTFRKRMYRCKESWIFNLEAMHDKLWCIAEDIREGNITLPIEIAGKVINNSDDLDNLQDEIFKLEWIAKGSKGVTGEQYGRIKTIVDWRVMARYNACMASGMSESEAGKCFEDI